MKPYMFKKSCGQEEPGRIMRVKLQTVKDRKLA